LLRGRVDNCYFIDSLWSFSDHRRNYFCARYHYCWYPWICFSCWGVVLSFSYFGSETGWITVGVSAAVSGLILYYSFKTNVWGRFSLKSSIDSKVNEGELDSLTVGMEGQTTSALRPIGKANLGDRIYEVKTLGDYLDSGSHIRVLKIISNQIIVEQIN
jgi:membrane-bound ClpP family serine protease